MSRIVLSNNKEVFENLVFHNLSTGLTLCVKDEMNGIYFATFYKRISKYPTFAIGSNGKYVLGSGTYIYNEKAKNEAIEMISKLDDSLLKIREKIIGNYCLAKIDTQGAEIICDKYGIFDQFYFYEDGVFAICNSLSDLAKAKEALRINKSGVIAETLLAGYIGNVTLFEGIYKLRGSEVINLTSSSFEVKKIEYNLKTWNYDNQTIDDAVNDYAKLITKYSNMIKKNWINTALHQTGGLDNRLVFSAMQSSKIDPLLLYGKGNSILTTTNKEDLDCVKVYARRFGLKSKIMDWSHSESDLTTKNRQKYFNKYGFKSTIYGVSSGFFSEYEGNIDNYPDFFEFGYYGENLRLREYMNEKNSVSIDEFFDSYLFGGGGGYGDLSNSKFMIDDELIKKQLKDQYIEEASYYGIIINDFITAKDFDRLRWVHARKADSRSLNFVNEFTDSFSLLSVPEIHEFPWSLPTEWRAKAEFQIRVIKALCPQALEVPIFSHGQLQKLNTETCSLAVKKQPAKRLKEILENSNVLNDKIIKKLTRLYFRLFERDMEKAELYKKNDLSTLEMEYLVEKYLDDDCPNDLKFVIAKEYPGHIVGLFRYFLHIESISNNYEINL